jgi:hypothetical protein
MFVKKGEYQTQADFEHRLPMQIEPCFLGQAKKCNMFHPTRKTLYILTPVQTKYFIQVLPTSGYGSLDIVEIDLITMLCPQHRCRLEQGKQGGFFICARNVAFHNQWDQICHFKSDIFTTLTLHDMNLLQ